MIEETQKNPLILALEQNTGYVGRTTEKAPT